MDSPCEGHSCRAIRELSTRPGTGRGWVRRNSLRTPKGNSAGQASPLPLCPCSLRNPPPTLLSLLFSVDVSTTQPHPALGVSLSLSRLARLQGHVHHELLFQGKRSLPASRQVNCPVHVQVFSIQNPASKSRWPTFHGSKTESPDISLNAVRPLVEKVSV